MGPPLKAAENPLMTGLTKLEPYAASMGPPLKAAENLSLIMRDRPSMIALQWGRR